METLKDVEGESSGLDLKKFFERGSQPVGPFVGEAWE